MKFFMRVLLMLAIAASFCSASTVILKDGAKIYGNIILEKDDYVVVDLGFTGLTIQREDIVEIEKETVDSNNIQTYTPQLESISNNDGKLYYTGGGNLKSIEENAELLSEAVVLVSHPAGLGSGFFINERGYLITNFHVIENETKITVTLFKKTDTGFDKIKFKKVKIIAINPFYDLALLQVEDLKGNDIKYVNLGNIEDLQVGQKVFAIGNPLGLERSVHDGIVSTKNRAFEGLVYIQTNTDINPGNSGGPLFNLKGEVVGVTNMGYIFMGGLGFAIPVNFVKDFIDNYEAFAYDVDAPNTGYKYLQPDGKVKK